MTVAAALADDHRTAPLPPPQQRLFQTEEDTQVLALCHWLPHKSLTPTAVVLHGLTGDANAGYVRATTAKLLRNGFSVVRLNARNRGGTEGLTPKLYHTGLTVDAKAVLTELATKDGLQTLFFAGFSMGGNVALKMAGEWGPDVPPELRGVAAISPPVDLAASSRAIDTGFMNGIYQRSFMRSLRKLVHTKARLFPSHYDVGLLHGVRTLRHFDDRFIAPCFGFDGADDYYLKASSLPVLDRISVPTLVVHATNDPLIPADPFEEWSEHVQLILTSTGGHTGFIASQPAHTASFRERDRFWAENRIVQFFDSLR